MISSSVGLWNVITSLLDPWLIWLKHSNIALMSPSSPIRSDATTKSNFSSAEKHSASATSKRSSGWLVRAISTIWLLMSMPRPRAGFKAWSRLPVPQPSSTTELPAGINFASRRSTSEW